MEKKGAPEETGVLKGGVERNKDRFEGSSKKRARGVRKEKEIGG